MPEWTMEQKQVIDSRGQSLLVSAAAGSGKTAVLVQRILEKAMDFRDPVDIDRLLVVTFTNAAAASLREKVQKRLEEEASGNDPERVKCALRQLSMLSSDHIETIDRFCREVVLDHADALGIDPSFRIADEGELNLLQSQTVSEVIEESYEDPEEDFREAFQEFSGLYAPGRTDEGLEDLILSFYAFSMSHEFPRQWRHACVEEYRGSSDGTIWMKDLLASIRVRFSEIHESLSGALSVCRKVTGPYHYTNAMQAHEELLSGLCACESMQEIADRLSGFAWPKPGSKKRGKDAPAVDPALEAYVKEVRNSAKKELQKLEEKFFFAPEERIEAMRLSTFRYMDVLARLTDRFEDRFNEAKAERRIADFSDVAHWALRVLIRTSPGSEGAFPPQAGLSPVSSAGDKGIPETDENGNYLRTRLAEEYADYFKEIYIDEYQDSNRVQEILLKSIARPGGRFMVGDMKQSIYRFRMADPGIFLEKAASYSFREDAPERRIDLHRNFRSRAMVLDAVNLIFRQVMRAQVGGVEYTTQEELRPGYLFPEEGAGFEDMEPELILVSPEDVPDAQGNVQAEAAAVALRIQSLVGNLMLYDKEKDFSRPAEYRDITILLRTASGWAETFSRVLDEYGIPNRPDASTGYFDAVEVRSVLAYLNVLDNPRQDIPLAASLRSPFGKVTDRELARIRQEKGTGPLYDCILEYAGSGKDGSIREKLIAFLERTKHLRSLVKDLPIHLLLWRIFDETGYEAWILAQAGGRQKKANLDLLTDMAMAYEQTSYRGLFHFVRYIEKLRKAQKDIGQAAESGGQENLVRIMTMHKSKGLEFPVVFVCGLNKRFNLQDARGPLVMHEHLGAGLDFRDPARRVKMENRIRSAIARRVKADTVGEELRVLYVAMTRAEQKLILTGCADSRKKAVEKAKALRTLSGEKLPAGVIEGASGMLEWILAALARSPQERSFFDSGMWEGPELTEENALKLPGRIRILTGSQVKHAHEKEQETEDRRLMELLSQDPDQTVDPAYRSRLEGMLTERYAFSEGRENMPGKMSVSEIKHEAYEAELRRIEEEEGTASLVQQAPKSEVPVPRFLQETVQSHGLSGAAMGSAYHLVLANLDFDQHRTKEQVEALLETMANCDKIQKEEAAAIDTGRIAAFLASDLAERMGRAQRAGKLWREQPFVIAKKAGQVQSKWSDEEQILLQGIIDAFFIEDGEVILVDYKTDRAKPGDEESLVRRYRVQFELYRDALEMLLRVPVREAWLYSLSLRKAVFVDLSTSGEGASPSTGSPAGRGVTCNNVKKR